MFLNYGLHKLSVYFYIRLLSSKFDNVKGGGFDKLLLDSLYEDDSSRRQIQLHHAGYGYDTYGYENGYGYGYGMAQQNPFEQVDPFAMSRSIAPPTNVQLAMMQQQQMMFQQPQLHQNNMMMVPHQSSQQYTPHHQQTPSYTGYSNPFGDPFGYSPQGPMSQHSNHSLL